MYCGGGNRIERVEFVVERYSGRSTFGKSIQSGGRIEIGEVLQEISRWRRYWGEMETDWLTKPENFMGGGRGLRGQSGGGMGDGRVMVEGEERGRQGGERKREGKKVERQGEGERENKEGERECVRICVNFE